MQLREIDRTHVYPNPFNPSVSLTYVTPSVGHVALTIYDITGRRVATLVDRAMIAGPHEARWDGRDEHGAYVSSGVYFAKLVSGNESVTRKLVLVR